MCCWPTDGIFGNMFTYRYMTTVGGSMVYHGCKIFRTIPGISMDCEIVIVLNKSNGKLRIINGEFEKDFKITWLRAVHVKDEIRKTASRRAPERATTV